jgi:hypothetical protein
MNEKYNQWLIAGIILMSGCFVRADIIVHEMGSTAANTLTTLGKDFIIGCAIVTAGMVVAAFVQRRGNRP